MDCTSCGASKQTAAFCIYCNDTQSVEPRPEPGPHSRWEYRDILVSLGVIATTGRVAPEPLEERRCQQVASEALQRARSDGWEPVGPMDWKSIARNRRVRPRREYGHSRLAHEYLEEILVLKVRRPAQRSGVLV